MEYYQDALGSEPWPWNQGGWNNLYEALADVPRLRPGRLVIKLRRLPRGLGPEDLQMYLGILADVARGDIFQHPPVALVFRDQDRWDVLHILHREDR